MTTRHEPLWFEILCCPLDHTTFHSEGSSLLCDKGHRFEVSSGIPIFSANPRREAKPANMGACETADTGSTSVDKFVDDWIVNTNGNLYWSVRGKLPRYPIPRWPFSSGDGKLLLDIGCSWGRWSMAAARAGYQCIGLDVHIDAVEAASRVTQQLGLNANFLCGDADHLPVRSRSVDLIFSYSVLQHLEKDTVMKFFAEASRVLKPGGICLVQLPNRFGIASIVQQMKRGFREALQGTFEMRYWSPREIRQALNAAGLSNLRLQTDGFLSQNPRWSDFDLLSWKGKIVILISETGRRSSKFLPVLTYLADSLWIEAQSYC